MRRAAVSMLLLALAGEAAGVAPVAVLQLEDFAAEDALEAWELRQVAGQILDGRARLGYPHWQWWRGKWPATILEYGRGGFRVQDWSRYDRLLFEVHNENRVPAQLKLRLDDAQGRRAIRIFTIPPQQSYTCKVAVVALAAELDIEQVLRFDLYMRQPLVDYSFILKNIRLEAHSLELQEAQLIADPFLGGQVQVQARLSRKAWCQVQVLDAGGGVAGRHAETTSRLEWKREGAPLSPGSYRVVLQVVDADWDADTLVRELGRFEVVPSGQRPALVAWQEPTTRKVLLHSRPRAAQQVSSWAEITGEQGGTAPLRIDMVQNEYEGIQVVFLARADTVEFGFALKELRHVETGAMFPLDGCAVYQVGYVHTKKPRQYPVEFAGWWPDPLLPVSRMRAEPGACMPVWLSLRSRADTRPGTYRGRLGIRVDGKRVGSLRLEVQVYSAVLPDSTTVRTAFSLYEHMLSRVYSGEVTPQLRGRYLEFIADHRLNVDHLYRRETPNLEEIEYLADRGRLNAFNLLYIKAGEDYDQARLEQLAAELDPYVEELRRRDLVERAYIYGFDEVGADGFDEMQRVFGFLKQRYPDVKTVTTARDPGYGLESDLAGVVDVWVPLTAAYDAGAAQQARARGHEVWWYLCIVPAHPYANWFVEYPALEARLLWWMAYQHRVPGVLYYAMNRWPAQDEPLRPDGSNRTSWNPASFETANGDGCLFYAGVDGPISTIRFENIRDGIEDYELLHLLAVQRGDEGALGRQFCGELIRSLVDFTRDVERFAQVRQGLLREVEQDGQVLAQPRETGK